ncbi:MAG: PKD domain-containing protein, partial [Promethearchaeota archaeon]
YYNSYAGLNNTTSSFSIAFKPEPMIIINEIYAGADDAIELFNLGLDVNMTNWTLNIYNYNSLDNTYTFPDGFILPRHRFVVIHEYGSIISNNETDLYTTWNIPWVSSDLACGLFDDIGSNVDWVQVSSFSGTKPADVTWIDDVNLSINDNYAFRSSYIDTDRSSDWSVGTVGTLGEPNPQQDLFPVASFTANATSIEKGESVRFTFTGAVGDPPATFQWDFGDGSPTSNDQDPIHLFNSEGDFTIRLTVTDFDDDVDSTIITIHVTQPPPTDNNNPDVPEPSNPPPTFTGLMIFGTVAGILGTVVILCVIIAVVRASTKKKRMKLSTARLPPYTPSPGSPASYPPSTGIKPPQADGLTPADSSKPAYFTDEYYSVDDLDKAGDKPAGPLQSPVYGMAASGQPLAPPSAITGTMQPPSSPRPSLARQQMQNRLENIDFYCYQCRNHYPLDPNFDPSIDTLCPACGQPFYLSTKCPSCGRVLAFQRTDFIRNEKYMITCVYCHHKFII